MWLIITILIILIVIIFLFFIPRNPLYKIWLKQKIQKEKRKQKILTALKKKDRITNNEVEKLLQISDATATRYLDELEKQGKIEQVGKRGGYIYYRPKK